ncbi:MAG: hypothetical protein ABI758_02595 [Candidatus Woesebacteria bacterium]
MAAEHQGEQMETEVISDPEMQEILSKRDQLWADITKTPDAWLKRTGNVYVAGGGAVLDVLEKESPYWKGMVANAKDGIISIATVPFQQDSLRRLHGFFTWRENATGDEKEYKECIDERLDDHAHGKEIHNKCGLIGGVEAASGLTGLENELAAKHGLKPEEKNALISGTESDHESTTIFVSFKSQSEVIDPDKKLEARAAGGLPFNSSVPVEQIAKYAKQESLSDEEQKDLLETVIKWSPRIARVIIGGHNKYKQAEDKTLIVIDKRGIDPVLAKEAEEALLRIVPHDKVKFVGEAA